jgi:ketosteroid isomerase-like protein
VTEGNEAVVRRFVDAFNSKDVDALVETLDRDVVIESSRGPRRGIEQAREWATREPGGVQQTVVVEDLEQSGERVLALARREWRWDGTDEMAHSQEVTFLFTLREGKIVRWQSFSDRGEARAAAGLK